jgi:hypothetical protein
VPCKHCALYQWPERGSVGTRRPANTRGAKLALLLSLLCSESITVQEELRERWPRWLIGTKTLVIERKHKARWHRRASARLFVSTSACACGLFNRA